MKHYSSLGSIIILISILYTPILAQQDTLTILHVNDTHSCLAPLAPYSQETRGGIARAATVIGQSQMTDPNVLLLHAGDLFIGDFFFNLYYGVAEFQLMLELGFDAMAVGNHEFDLTPVTLKAALDSSFVYASFPLLSANLVLEDPAVQTLKEYIQPLMIKQVGNVKVGIFGMTTPETNIFSLPQPAVIDTNIIQIAMVMVDSLQREQCDVIICLSHLGFDLDNLLASMVGGIDVIVGGHDHYLLQEPAAVANAGGTTTWIVQLDAFYSYVGKLQIIIEESGISLSTYQAIPLDNNIPEEPTTAAIIGSLIAEIETTYGPVYTEQVEWANGYFKEVSDSLMDYGYKDTHTGNLVCDAFRAATGTDIAIEPGGSTAQPLYQGGVTGADIFRVVGYGFNTDNGLGYRLATFDINGAILLAGLEYGLSQIDLNDELFMQVSGMNYVYNPANEPFSRLLSVSVNGVPLNPGETYSVTTNEFVVAFLDYMQLPYENLSVLSGVSEYQALYDYITSIGFFHPYQYGRIIAENDPSPDFWQHTNAPLKAKYSDITVTSNNHIFIAAEDSGIYRSLDRGITWSRQNNGLTYPIAMTVAEAPNGNLFAGSWGVFRSTNNGDLWEPAGSTLMVPFCFAFKSENETDYIFAGTGGGIFRSSDNGNTWDTTSTGLAHPNSSDVWSIAISPNGSLFAATGEGLYTSSDNGDNWSLADTVFYLSSVKNITINSKGDIFRLTMVKRGQK